MVEPLMSHGLFYRSPSTFLDLDQDERRSHGFEMTRGWVITDRIVILGIFGWTKPLNSQAFNLTLKHITTPYIIQNMSKAPAKNLYGKFLNINTYLGSYLVLFSLRIAWYKLTILTFFSQNCETNSQLGKPIFSLKMWLYKSQLRVCFSQFW